MFKSNFIVVEHNAKRAGLHWDLRFQLKNSDNWDSFAVRKGVPLLPGKKVLAVKTNIHSTKEALFLGTIESGYGAGKFKEWDRGRCIVHRYTIGHISIEFKGKKIKGIYHLVNVGVVDKNFKGLQYFLFKGKLVKESSGMAGRVPTCGIKVDTEEGQSEEEGTKLSWSLAEYLKMLGGKL